MSDQPVRPNEFIASLPREQARAVIERRVARWRRRVLDLARDLAAFNGTSVQYELALLERDIKQALAEHRGDPGS